MKKLFILMAALAAVVASCNSKDELTPKGPESEEPVEELVLNDILPNGYRLVCDLGLGNGDDGTRAIKSGWAEGDMIFAFFDDITEGYLRLVNNAGSNTGWGCGIEGDLSGLEAGEGVNMHLIYVPFADAKVKATYKDGKWNINTGDVYFTSITAKVDITGNPQSKEMRITSENTINLEMADGYAQIWIDKDAYSINPVTLEYVSLVCNMLDRFTSVDVTINAGEASFAPVAATSGKDTFTGRQLSAEGKDGIVFYGKIMAAESRPATTLFEVTNAPLTWTYKLYNRQLTEAKAYSLPALGSNEGLDGTSKFRKWVRTLNGKFNVGTADAPKYIRFTTGNLIFNEQNTPQWRFAQNQYDVIGALNALGWWQDPAHPEKGKLVYPNNYDYDLFNWGATGVKSNKEHSASVDPIHPLRVELDIPHEDPGIATKTSYFPTTVYRQDLVNVFPVPNNANPIYGGGSYGESAFFRTCTPENKTGSANPGDDWGSNTVDFCYYNTYYTLSAIEWLNLFENSYWKIVCIAKYDGSYRFGILLFPEKNSSATQVIDQWLAEAGGTNLHESLWSMVEYYGGVFLPMTGIRRQNNWPVSNSAKVIQGYDAQGNAIEVYTPYTGACLNYNIVYNERSRGYDDFRATNNGNIWHESACVYWSSTITAAAVREDYPKSPGHTWYDNNFPGGFSLVNSATPTVGMRFPFESHSVRLVYDTTM